MARNVPFLLQGHERKHAPEANFPIAETNNGIARRTESADQTRYNVGAAGRSNGRGETMVMHHAQTNPKHERTTTTHPWTPVSTVGRTYPPPHVRENHAKHGQYRCPQIPAHARQ